MPIHYSDLLGISTDEFHKKAQLQQKLLSLPNFPPTLKNCLILGPQFSGKTAALLHLAYKKAAEGTGPVIFIRHRSKKNLDAPLLPEGIEYQPCLENIWLRYLSSLRDLQQYAALLHLLPTPPAALLVDDFSLFQTSDSDGSRSIMDALSHLHDAADWASKAAHNLHVGNDCPLVVSDGVARAEVPRLLFLMRHWLPCVLQLTAIGGGLEVTMTQSTFQLHNVQKANRVVLMLGVDTNGAYVISDIRDAHNAGELAA